MNTLDKLERLGHYSSRMGNRDAYIASVQLAKNTQELEGLFITDLEAVARHRQKQVGDLEGNGCYTSLTSVGLIGGVKRPVFLDTDMVLQLARDAARDIRTLQARVKQLEASKDDWK